MTIARPRTSPVATLTSIHISLSACSSHYPGPNHHREFNHAEAGQFQQYRNPYSSRCLPGKTKRKGKKVSIASADRLSKADTFAAFASLGEKEEDFSSG